jgi:hypothetical protein
MEKLCGKNLECIRKVDHDLIPLDKSFKGVCEIENPMSLQYFGNGV